MDLKQFSRFLVMLGMLASVGLVIAGNVASPLFSTTSPKATYATWTNCQTSGGVYACYKKFSTPAANAECSEMDDRTTTVAVFSIIWVVAAIHTVFALLWEVAGHTQPLSSMCKALFCWTGGVGVALAVMLTQTLIARLCDSPLTFTEMTGKMEVGGILICCGAATSAIPFLIYFFAPSGESSPTEKRRSNPQNPARVAGQEGASASPL